MNALSKGGLVFKRLRRYSLFGKKKKNPLNVIWYAISINRDIQIKQNSEVLLSLDDINKEVRSLRRRVSLIEKPIKRGRPKKTQTK